MKICIPILTFIVAMSFFAFLAWCGGFNFDKRTPDVALGIFMAAALSGVCAGFTAELLNKK